MKRAISQLASMVLVVLALLAAGLAYGHTRLALAAAYNSNQNLALAALHLDAIAWIGRRDSRWRLAQARVLLARAEAASEQDRRAQLRAGAVTQLQAALELSPLSSDAWTWLAVARLQQGNSDPLFDLAFARSLELGPNENRNLVALLPWAFLQWSSLSQIQQQQVLGRAEQATQWIPSWVVSTASRYGQLYTLCDRLGTGTRVARPCQSNGWTAAE